ncbi:MAG: tetratricopeptide repeat protein [Myxococcota bacterium]
MANKASERHNERGIELALKGWEAEALCEFEKAIVHDPEFAPPYDNIANVYAERGQHLEALKLYIRALELAPDDSTIHYNFGCFLSNYASDMAIAAYRHAGQSASSFPEVHLNLGMSLMAGGHMGEAIEQLQIATQAAPNDAAASYELACALLQTGQFKEAVSEFRRATLKDPEQQAAWFQLGSCYLQQGFYTEANNALARALQLEPKDPFCLCELACLRHLQGQEKESQTLLEKGLKLDRPGVESRILKTPHLKILKRP